MLDNLLQLAIDEIGYKEKSWEAYNQNPNVIYEKFEGAGSDNVTKYAKEMDDLCVYNGIKNGYPWCKVFIDWLFVKTYGEEKAKDLLLGWTAGVEQFYYWMRDAGKIANNPKVGDLVIFGDCDHIGIVELIDNNYIYTVEGNTSGEVEHKKYSKSNSWIKCYARPDYDENPHPTPSGDEEIRKIQEWVNSYGFGIEVDGYFGYQTKKGIIKVYQTEINKQYGTSLEVDGEFGPCTYYATPIVMYGAEGNITKAIQSMLYCRGYNTDGVDGLFYDGTYRAIEQFQSNHGLTVDGIFGPNTAEKLFE